MLTDIIAKIKKGQFWQFPGGVNPPGKKSLSNELEIERLPLADKLYIPVKQHVGVAGRVSVEINQRVLKGQQLTHSMNPFAVPVHAPTSGTIRAVQNHVSNSPSGIEEKTIVLEPDGQEEWIDLNPLSDYQSLPRVSLVEEICSAGIAGMGGAGFPAHIKLSSGKNIEFLIINGVECEPYITSDDRLMREHAWQIRQGIDVLCHILKPQQVIIAIEDNKPEAFAAMEIAFQDNSNYLLCAVETKYPAGGEKQLIQVLTGKEVPSRGLPVDIGIIMHNVGTCFAIADAVFTGKPLIERVVTLTGEAIERPQNVWLPIGTPVGHAIEQCNYRADKQVQKRIIMGGPMMGYTLHSDLVPVVKTTNCLLVPADTELPTPGEELPCIRCGACADACPAGLLPQQLHWHAQSKEYDKAKELNLFDCIECGACAFVCPSNIPLVHSYRSAKAEIRIQEDEALKAAKAKERFEARNARLEKEKQEREEKARQSAAARAERQKKSDSQSDNPNAGTANDRVAAALARAKAKKAQQQSDTSASASDVVAAQQNKTSSEQQDRVAAAIARAKAKKAQQAQEAQSADEQEPLQSKVNDEAVGPIESSKGTEEEDKKARVAAAIARAKAKKIQNTPADNNLPAESNSTGEQLPELELEESAQPAPDSGVNPTSETTKQDKIAAAIARAKAKKAARAQSENNNDNEN